MIHLVVAGKQYNMADWDLTQVFQLVDIHISVFSQVDFPNGLKHYLFLIRKIWQSVNIDLTVINKIYNKINYTLLIFKF